MRTNLEVDIYKIYNYSESVESQWPGVVQMDVRKQRGQEIDERCHLERCGNLWFVPSQSSGGKYTVRIDPNLPTCSCPDWELREMKCKHIYAVEYRLKRCENVNGTTTTTQTVTVTQAVKKPTYKQQWCEYNRAQTNEKDKFQTLLASLCSQFKTDAPRKRGQQPLSPADALFACCFKVYSTVSGRRFMSDLREAVARGHITRAPHYNSIFNYLEDASLTEVLRSLITQTALPLKAVEQDFACDSSGFMTSRFTRWFDVKYGAPRQKQDWVKCHLMCGVKTNVVTAVEIHDMHAGDAPQLPALVDATAKNFTIREVSADKGYSSGSNHDAIAKAGATPFIAFKDNTTAKGGGLFETMFHFFSLHRELFLSRYHKRSNVETTFSMIKAKFGDSVRSKTDTAMKNEVLAKIVCHNIVCVIHELYEAGLEPQFWGQAVPA
jgi:transposase